MVCSVLVLYGAGSAGLVHRGGTETESRGASRDMDPAWGHGEGRKKKKPSCAKDPRSGNGRDWSSVTSQYTSPLLLSRGQVEDPRGNYEVPRGSNGSDTTLNFYRSLEFFKPTFADPFKGVETRFTFTRVISDGGQRLVWLPEFFFLLSSQTSHLWHKPQMPPGNEKKL